MMKEEKSAAELKALIIANSSSIPSGTIFRMWRSLPRRDRPTSQIGTPPHDERITIRARGCPFKFAKELGAKFDLA